MWNTVKYNGEFSDKEFYNMIDHSYNEVVKGLTKKLRDALMEIPS